MKLKEAIDYFGSQAKLARALGINPSAVTQWDDEIPARRQYELERLTGGRLKADAPEGQQPGTQEKASMYALRDLAPGEGQENPVDLTIRLAALVAQLSLLIEDAAPTGNVAALFSLQAQYHRAMADLLDATRLLDSAADPRTETQRQRHVERAVEYQRQLDLHSRN